MHVLEIVSVMAARWWCMLVFVLVMFWGGSWGRINNGYWSLVEISSSGSKW